MDLLINYEVYVLFYLIILLMYVYFFKPVERPNKRSGTTDDDDNDEDVNLFIDPENMADETALDDYYMPPPVEPQPCTLRRAVSGSDSPPPGTSSQTQTSGTSSQTPAAGPSSQTPTQSPRPSPLHTPTSSPALSLTRAGSGQTIGSGSDVSTSRRTPRQRPKARKQRTDHPTISASSSAHRRSSRGRSSTPNTPFNRGRGRAAQLQDPGPRRSSPRFAPRQPLTAVVEASQPRRSPRQHHPGKTGARTPGLRRTTSNTRSIGAQRELKYPEL